MIDDLEAILGRYPPSTRPIGEPVALGNAGGASGARLWQYASARGAMVLRAWPPDGPGPAAIRRIHEYLSRTRGLGFVAIPERDRAGETVQEFAGRAWEVAPWMSGVADLGRPPGRARLRAGFAGLAGFHRATAWFWNFGSSPGLSARLRELEGLLGGGFADLERAIARGGTDPARDPARRWLDLARRVAPVLSGPLREAAAGPSRLAPFLHLQVCLRDPRPDHFLFEGDRLTGLVDFGAMGLECVAADLARLLAEWAGPDRADRAEALDAYQAIRPLEPAEAALIAAFERPAALLIGAHWARWHFIEGRTFDDPDAVPNGLRRGLDRLADLAAALTRS